MHYVIISFEWWVLRDKLAQWMIYLETSGIFCPLFSDITQTVVWRLGRRANTWEEPASSFSFFSFLPRESSVHIAEAQQWKVLCGWDYQSCYSGQDSQSWDCLHALGIPGLWNSFANELGSNSQATGRHVWLKWRSTRTRGLCCRNYHGFLPISSLP